MKMMGVFQDISLHQKIEYMKSEGFIAKAQDIISSDLVIGLRQGVYLNDQVVCATDKELVSLALRVVQRGARTRRSTVSLWFQKRSRSIGAIEDAVEKRTLDTLVAGLPGRASLEKRPLLNRVISVLVAE